MKPGVKHTIKTDKAYFLTMTTVGWADVFTRKNHKDLMIDSLRYCVENKGLQIYAFCLMSNHLHLLTNTDCKFNLADTIRDFKKFTSKKIVEQIEEEPESRREWLLSLFATATVNSSKHKDFRFWQPGNHAIEVFNSNFAWEKVNYIHENPVRAGFVRKVEDWIYSSASNYAGLDSVLEVHTLTPVLRTW